MNPKELIDEPTPPAIREPGYYWIACGGDIDEETETYHPDVDIAHWDGKVWCNLSGPDYDWDDGDRETVVIAGPLAPPPRPPPEPLPALEVSMLRWRKHLVALQREHPDWPDARARAEATHAYPEVRPFIFLTAESIALLDDPVTDAPASPRD